MSHGLSTAHAQPAAATASEAEDMHAPDEHTEDHIDDHALMQRIGTGDREAFALLSERHLKRFYGFASRLLGNRQDAEEVMQDVFLKLWLEAPRWQPQARFTTWFYRVVANSCTDRLRQRKPSVPIDTRWQEGWADTRDNAETLLMQQQTGRRVQDAVAKLPEKQRLALVLFHYEEHSQQDVAAILGTTVAAVESLLFRARQSLKAGLLHEQ